MHWVTGSEAARMLGVPLGTVHRWASLDRWRRTGKGSTTRYSWEDATNSFRKYRDTPKSV